MLDFIKKIKDVFIKNVPDTSPAGKVDGTDAAKVVKTGALVGIAATLSFLVTSLDPAALGPYQPYVMLGLTVALDLVNKLIKSNS